MKEKLEQVMNHVSEYSTYYLVGAVGVLSTIAVLLLKQDGPRYPYGSTYSVWVPPYEIEDGETKEDAIKRVLFDEMTAVSDMERAMIGKTPREIADLLTTKEVVGE